MKLRNQFLFFVLFVVSGNINCSYRESSHDLRWDALLYTDKDVSEMQKDYGKKMARLENLLAAKVNHIERLSKDNKVLEEDNKRQMREKYDISTRWQNVIDRYSQSNIQLKKEVDRVRGECKLLRDRIDCIAQGNSNIIESKSINQHKSSLEVCQQQLRREQLKNEKLQKAIQEKNACVISLDVDGLTQKRQQRKRTVAGQFVTESNNAL